MKKSKNKNSRGKEKSTKTLKKQWGNKMEVGRKEKKRRKNVRREQKNIGRKRR